MKSKRPKAATQLRFDRAGTAANCQPPLLPAEDKRERLRREFAVLCFLCDCQRPYLLTGRMEENWVGNYPDSG